jgi:hypothetical protein
LHALGGDALNFLARTFMPVDGVNNDAVLVAAQGQIEESTVA